MRKSAQRRARTIALERLEDRSLLSSSTTSPMGIWLGQDGHDLVGPSSTPGPDGIQDMHIELTGLPSNLSISSAVVYGDGSGEWSAPSTNGTWAAALVQAPGATTADIYIEPYQFETGRQFQVNLTYSDQTTATIYLQGGTANPNLWMTGQGVTMQWLGQDGHDWTGPTASVGPDGFQDVHLALANLSSTLSVQSVILTASGGGQWAFGTNPSLLPDAELFPSGSDPTKADLYFSPTTDLAGQTLTLTVTYSNGKSDATQILAGTTNPTLAMPSQPAVVVNFGVISAQWIGQDGQNLNGPGDVHVGVTGIPANRTVVAAQLTDGTRTYWNFDPSGILTASYASPMAFQTVAGDATSANLDFPPTRNESQATMTLRLVLDDGTNLVTTFAGGFADPGLRTPNIAASSIVAHPGDDLNLLANSYGTVHLSAGTYNLSAPLVLDNPVTITADPGTTLLFTQPAGATPWTAAIKINAGHTTLNGFAVRFAGPVQWNWNVSYSPAVIGTSDNLDPTNLQNQLKVDVTLTHLDLQSPPAASTWEQAPSLIRAVSAQDGLISNNVLKGGTTEFFGGPWQVTNNQYEGTVPDTYTYTAFAGHYTNGLVLSGNQAQPFGPSGKTWRFLVLTQSGIGDVVQNNDVVGIGPMDTDTVPNPNAPEVILTEAYHLAYEGVPSSISDNGMVIQIESVLAGSVSAGDVLALLAGPDAGQWREISQVIDPTTFLLSSPVDPGTTAVSIATGFINESFVGNTVDTRGSSDRAGHGSRGQPVRSTDSE